MQKLTDDKDENLSNIPKTQSNVQNGQINEELDSSIMNNSRMSRTHRKERRNGAPPKVDMSVLTNTN